MATRTIEAFINVTDLRDGTAGISVLVSNENHTFVADTDGSIEASALAAFSTDISVLVGTTAYAFQPSGTLQPGQWKISDGNNDGATAITVAGGLTASVADRGNDARITIADATAGNGFADGGASSPDSVQFVVPIQTRIGADTRQFNRILTFAKAKGGSATVLTLTATDEVLPYDSEGDLREPTRNVIFQAELENFPGSAGNVVWEYRLSPTAAWTAIPSTAGFVRSESHQRRLTMTRTVLAGLLTGDANQISVRATLSGRYDVVSVAALRDGASGQAAVDLRIVPRSSTVLLNNQGSVTLDALLFYKGLAADAAISQYQWVQRSGGTNTNISGATSSSLEVDARPSGSGTRSIGCRVGYDDEHAAVTG